MFQRFYSLALNTFIETVRQPIYGVILLATAAMLILNVSLAAFTLDDDDSLLLDLGLSTLMLSGLFLSAFSAAGVLSREIENKTVLTVISKPISRPIFILGKFAGLTAALAVAFYISMLVFILAQRHGVLQNTSDPWDVPVLVFGLGSVLLSLFGAAYCNYFYGRDFPTTLVAFVLPLLSGGVLAVAKFDEHWDVIPFASNFVGGQVIIAVYLVWLMAIVTAAVALAASTRFGQLMTLVICTAVLGIGLVSDSAFGRHEATSILAAGAYRAFPNMGPFWVVDGLRAGTEQTAVPWQYVGLTSAYAALLVVGTLGIAIAAFQRREVG
ncbi:MAG: ABC transporter permease subunit [Planctomycetes bacterium]|nr:ABC transporter permease subunit [Planctomycetota bacterium]